VILSEFPIEDSQWLAYSACTSWDCLVRKGVLSARIRVPGIETPVTILDTHTNADPSYDPTASRKKARRARAKQMREAADFFARVRPSGKPALFVGDFNALPDAEDYRGFVDATHLLDAVEFCGRQGSCSGDREALREWSDMLDHQFYSPGDQVAITPVHYDLLFKEAFEGKPITDHPITWVTYRLESQ
jgi:endonuclease/exonuclease/phosphatase family metal-dependent hydrolase